MHKILIYTDGASKGNPGPGGWGAIVVCDGSVAELGGREAKTTNNRMEMRAALEALRHASGCMRAPIIVHTDSSYLINGITKWVPGWRARGWMTAQKKEVLNRDLWEALVEATDAAGEIEWHYVGGHVGIPGNERADEIASNFALGKKVELHVGLRDGYLIDVERVTHDVNLHRAKSTSRSRSKQKAYSYVSEVNGVVKVHKTWAECEARVRGKKARYKKAINREEEGKIMQQFES